MKRRVAAFFCLILVVMGILALPALAANTCSQITGSSAGSRTFTVNTGSRWAGSDRLKLTQSKGTVYYYNAVHVLKTTQAYGVFTVTYTKEGGGTKTVTWKDSSLSLKLDKNSTYTVTIKPSDGCWSRPVWAMSLRCFDSWKTNPTWRVSSTKGILSCS